MTANPPCPNCGGPTIDDGWTPVFCGKCGDVDKYTGRSAMVTTCPECKGLNVLPNTSRRRHHEYVCLDCRDVFTTETSEKPHNSHVSSNGKVYAYGQDLTGETFGRLTVKERLPQQGDAKYRCECDCGEFVEAYGHNLRSGATKSCGCLKAGPTNHKYREVILNNSGYALVWAPDHPRARHSRVLEHVIVMERMIGRYLLPEEEVHHRNRVRTDNREENLELWSGSHPKTARVEDLVEWAESILALYKTK